MMYFSQEVIGLVEMEAGKMTKDQLSSKQNPSALTP